jgi:hypothetical protein
MSNYVLKTLETLPGKDGKTFTIRFAEDYNMARNDIMVGVNGVKCQVTKVYRFNIWRRILCLFGIEFKMFNCVVVKEIESKQ